MNYKYTKWDEITDRLEKLNIIENVEQIVGPGDEYETRVTIHNDVKFKGLKYKTTDLEDMVEELEVYYLQAKNENNIKRFLDITSSLWWAWVSAWTFLTSLAFFGGATFITLFLLDAGLGPEIMEALKDLVR